MNKKRIPQAFKPYQPKKEGLIHVRADSQTTNNVGIDLDQDRTTLGEMTDLGVKNMLPFAADVYKLSSNLEDYVILPTPVCPSDIPNRNGIAFPLAELVKFRPFPIFRQAYKAWSGTPIHIEHDNLDPTKAIGILFDTSLIKVEGFNGGKFWQVIGVLGIDKTKSPDYAQAMLDNNLKTFSMGAEAATLCCSVCGAQAFPDPRECCSHIRKGSADINFDVMGYGGQQRLIYLNAYDLTPFEISAVSNPAWISATSDAPVL